MFFWRLKVQQKGSRVETCWLKAQNGPFTMIHLGNETSKGSEGNQDEENGWFELKIILTFYTVVVILLTWLIVEMVKAWRMEDGECFEDPRTEHEPRRSASNEELLSPERSTLEHASKPSPEDVMGDNDEPELSLRERRGSRVMNASPMNLTVIVTPFGKRYHTTAKCPRLCKTERILKSPWCTRCGVVHPEGANEPKALFPYVWVDRPGGIVHLDHACQNGFGFQCIGYKQCQVCMA